MAASFCLEMVANRDLKQVWCETQDDITLIWGLNDLEEVEFIQVKDIKFGHLWSVAELCKREKTAKNPSGLGTSILEKSLAHDRCRESCRFRMVTSWQVNGDLKVVTLPLTSPVRCPSNERIASLCEKVGGYLPDFRSEKGNDCSFWLANVYWQVRHAEDAVKRENVHTLMNLVASDGGGRLPPELIEQRIYPRLLQKAKQAAEADWEVNPDAKRIGRDDFRDWLGIVVREAQFPASAGAGREMQRKMEDASLPSDYIQTAHEERRLYRQMILTAQYLDVSDKELTRGEVHAVLGHLRSRLDTNELAEGIAYYEACLRRLRGLQESLPTRLRPPLFFLDGCMHDITDRCGHRYRRIPE